PGLRLAAPPPVPGALGAEGTFSLQALCGELQQQTQQTQQTQPQPGSSSSSSSGSRARGGAPCSTCSMEEFLQRTKSRLNRGKQLEKVHTVIGNKSCDLDSIISTLTYAYYLDKISSPSVLCLPVLNVPRVEFHFYSETRFILEELDIPESFLIFKDEINLQHFNDEGRLSITLVNYNALTSEDPTLEASVVKVINPDERFDGSHDLHESSSSSLVAKEIVEEAPELVTRQLAHLLRGSILFSVCP
ncbi:hypothetical protein FKM82_000630, partial [Ascaphus truei]